ncbi:hypothetical protein MJ575_05600 [Klebsiella pneumoniae]|nr:hypothetical protein MJ575_05600 [Klebsiella pneumoniae]
MLFRGEGGGGGGGGVTRITSSQLVIRQRFVASGMTQGFARLAPAAGSG